MANPQPDQYTKISNELMEQIPFYKFNGTQLRLLFVILRFTYGFNRKEKDLSLKFLSEATNIHKEQVKRELNSLIDKKVITVVCAATFKSTRVLAFNKDYESWEIERSIQEAKKITGSENATIQETNSLPLQEANSLPKKESIKKNSKTNICDMQFEAFWKEYPRKVSKGDAHKCWNARLKDGCKADDLIKAAKNYAIECRNKGTEYEYTKHPKTFLSKTKPFEDYICQVKEKESIYQDAEPDKY